MGAKYGAMPGTAKRNRPLSSTNRVPLLSKRSRSLVR